MVFIGAILFVILATNLTLRGMASVIAIAFLIILVLFLWVMNWWDPVLLWLGGLDVRMNAGGYLAVAIPLCIIWLFSTFIYDHYTYLLVSRGQVRVRQQIGEGELAVDASGLLLEKNSAMISSGTGSWGSAAATCMSKRAGRARTSISTCRTCCLWAGSWPRFRTSAQKE